MTDIKAGPVTDVKSANLSACMSDISFDFNNSPVSLAPIGYPERQEAKYTNTKLPSRPSIRLDRGLKSLPIGLRACDMINMFDTIKKGSKVGIMVYKHMFIASIPALRQVDE